MVLNDTCNNILVVSWCSVLLVEETWLPVKNRQPVANLKTNFERSAGFKLTTLIVIATDYIGSYKSNYHIKIFLIFVLFMIICLIKKKIYNIFLISILFRHSSETYKNICLSDSCPIGEMDTVVPLETKFKFEKCGIHIIIPIHILKVRKLGPLKCYSVICDPFISI